MVIGHCEGNSVIINLDEKEMEVNNQYSETVKEKVKQTVGEHESYQKSRVEKLPIQHKYYSWQFHPTIRRPNEPTYASGKYRLM